MGKSMIGDLNNKVAFVTGAAGGIGLGMARAFAEAGMKIAIADIDAKTLEEVGAELEQAGATVLTVPLDVADLASWKAAAGKVEQALGPVQLLCNNAGVSTLGMPFDTISPELWGKVVNINLNGVFNGVHTFLDGMRAAGGGHIVNTSSMGGMFGVANLSPYVATKFAVVGLSEALRAEFAADGIGVSVLCPGSVRSRLWRTSRPIRGLPDTDVPPDDASAQSARATGMDPFEVGLRVVGAVRQNQLYIFTHAEFRAPIAGRCEKLMEGFDCTDAYNAANPTPA
jgi:NAD(P)-dependent dehydrogenase (short-subunit alcohol dehydrogenase family)